MSVSDTPTLTRRAFIARLAALAAMSQVGGCTEPQPLKLDTDPFTLGVASGDPSPDGAVLWTRLAPDPLHGGGMPAQAVDATLQSNPTRDLGGKATTVEFTDTVLDRLAATAADAR